MKLIITGWMMFICLAGMGQETERYMAITKKLDKAVLDELYQLGNDSTAEVTRYQLLNYTLKHPDLLKTGDLNGNGKLQGFEVRSLIRDRKVFVRVADREEAAKLLLLLDLNRDGFLEELVLPQNVITAIETKIGHDKYSAFNGGLLRDSENRMRRGGSAEVDSRISVHEFINAMTELEIVVGEEFNIWTYFMKG